MSIFIRFKLSSSSPLRHQASDGGGTSAEESAKVKKAANLLQQRKMLQRNLRNLQQHTLSREILSSELPFPVNPFWVYVRAFWIPSGDLGANLRSWCYIRS